MSEEVSQFNEIAADLAVFADIGTEAPRVVAMAEGCSIFLVRHGESSELQFTSDLAVVEIVGDIATKHASLRALLASDRYGALKDWAAKQRAFLETELPPREESIPIAGRLDGSIDTTSQSELDDLLVLPQGASSTRVVLIDGPAGIGKTHFIQLLAATRCDRYAQDRRPLILHVQSRGRTLSYLYDLMAFSLQRLRLEVTYDQVPVLAKHGLVTIAIDGFDELADPDGYDKAWSQVSELVESLRGNGAIILAGRETFIGRNRIKKEIASIRVEDEVFVFTLQAPSKGEAIVWLKDQGWTEEGVSSVEAFLEPNSLALRPFFLKTLSDPAIYRPLMETEATSVLAILMDAMINREITKFGEAVDGELSEHSRRIYIRSLMGEVAREMAENGSLSISDASLSWMVEVALPHQVSDSVMRLLKARSQALAFLTNDERPGHRRFFHDKFLEYFLALVVIETVGRAETSKFLARSILGSSFLETFGTILYGGTGEAETESFFRQASTWLREYPPIDRTRRNLGALLIAALPAAESITDFEISEVDVDEARTFGTAAECLLRNLIISQLDCRGADLSHATFEGCQIFTLIGDNGTLLPSAFPTPTRIQDISLGAGLASPEDTGSWVLKHLANPPEEDSGLLPGRLREHEAVRLLARACRMRQHWLRGGDDVHAAKILNDAYWPLVERALEENGLARVEFRQASGTDARFIHIRKPQAILEEDPTDPEIVQFYKQLTQELDELDNG